MVIGTLGVILVGLSLLGMPLVLVLSQAGSQWYPWTVIGLLAVTAILGTLLYAVGQIQQDARRAADAAERSAKATAALAKAALRDRTERP